jgi:uncharacterized protein
MGLQQKIDQDLKQAMIAKDQARLDAIRMLKSAIKYVAIEKPGAELTDADVMQVIQKQIKQRRESVDQFSKNGRADMAAKEEKEALLYESYLPKQISDAELDAAVQAVVKEIGASTKKDFGRAMKAVTDKLAGGADNKRISTALGKVLQ